MNRTQKSYVLTSEISGRKKNNKGEASLSFRMALEGKVLIYGR